ITIDYLGSLFIPNAFSPGLGDDETGYFIPKGVGLREFLVEIFSPYGERVWWSDKLVDGQPVEKWDGTHNRKDVPQGAYVWQIRAIFERGVAWQGMQYGPGEPFRRTGSVNVIR
ncbi:MAG: gliding motility-associated C-terminal domain-containing protein, partial [Bacteroidota bacterium]